MTRENAIWLALLLLLIPLWFVSCGKKLDESYAYEQAHPYISPSDQVAIEIWDGKND